ncbi:MAG: zinc ribbon domain-containing protein, partial [Chitinophagaceae bacterium]|nr:zinc ribbon domain-containing protein [Rubrivivax sp.]
MPIYAYRCSTCGHAQDVLQKLSDPVLSVCPACGAGTYAKQLTAAGFQLKGSGWYVTDFRDGKQGAKKEGEVKEGEAKEGDKPAAEPANAGDSAGKPADKPVDKPTTDKPGADKAPAASPAVA